jgi:sialate O-acetylesterase
MIIQRDRAFPVWSGKKVTVAFLGKTYEARQEGDRWLATIEPVGAGGPFTMDIVSDEGKVTIQDIYSGDVWLCAGQSNMELQMERLRDDYSEEWKQDFPLIRQFKVPQEWDFSGPRAEFSGGSWVTASAETLAGFSGTAWFFAKKMHERYSELGLKIPIGLINTAWGGTPVESWMSAEALADFPEKIADSRQYCDPSFCGDITEKNGATVQEWESRLKNEDRGLLENWRHPQTDISIWDEITLPGDFIEAGLYHFCGAIWLTREFEVSGDFAAGDAKLWLGTITDSDTVYINGVEVGNTGYRYPPRKYSVPAGTLKQGKNRIVIRVICNNGEGGVTRDKPFRLFSGNETVELSGTWKYKVGVSISCIRPKEFFFQWQPMGTYNAMIAPALKYHLKGVIWYQGESNGENPKDYAKLFRCMIQDWRKKNRETLPFLFVQLPIYGKPAENSETSSWALLREAQAQTMSLPLTGMAAALDAGEWNDLHPLNKKDIGFRLFLAAEKTLFGVNNTSPGPVLIRYERRGERLFLFFNNCGNGLTVKSSETVDKCETVNSFPVDEKPYVSVIGDVPARLPAEIEGPDVISVDISSVKNAKKILYAWANNPRDRQLYNSDGLPMLPFRLEF